MAWSASPRPGLAFSLGSGVLLRKCGVLKLGFLGAFLRVRGVLKLSLLSIFKLSTRFNEERGGLFSQKLAMDMANRVKVM
jgi:hypothetical protein